MAAAFVRAASGTGTSANPSATLGAAPTLDDLLVAFVTTSNTSALTTINSYTARSEVISTRRGKLFDKIAGGSETAAQAPATVAAAVWTCNVAEYSGIDTTNRLDIENSQADNDATKTSPTVNPTDNIDVLIVGCAFMNASGSFSTEKVDGSTTGVNERLDQASSGSTGCVWDWFGNTSTSTHSTEVTASASSAGGAWVAVYKVAVTGNTLSTSDSGALTNEDVLGISIPLTDSGALVDELVIVRASVTTDSGSSTETMLLISIPLTDAGALAAELATLAAAISATDSGSSTEDVLARTLSTLDTGTLTELLGDRTLASTDDSVLASELASLLAAFSSSDSGALASEIVVLLSQLFSVTDSGALVAELVTVLDRAIADSGALAGETITDRIFSAEETNTLSTELVTTFGRALVDSGALASESVTDRTMFLLETLALASEVASLLTGLSATDSGALAAELVITFARELTDTGALATELVTAFARALVDSGSVTEFSLLEALSFFTVSDSGALASEVASVAAGLAASDSGALASEILGGRGVYLTDAGEALLETFRRTRDQDPRAGATVRVGAILSTETAIVVGVQQRVERIGTNIATHTATVEGPEQRDVRTSLSES